MHLRKRIAKSCLLYTSKKPIQWGDFEVKMVMLLATNEEQSNILKMFFSWLSNMINDANHFAALLETKSYEEFIAKIIE